MSGCLAGVSWGCIKYMQHCHRNVERYLRIHTQLLGLRGFFYDGIHAALRACMRTSREVGNTRKERKKWVLK